jgi:tetratricopeptide (TPR) repeat protein
MNRIKQLILITLILVSGNSALPIDLTVVQAETLPAVTIPDRLESVRNQDPSYPLKTRISKDIEGKLSKFFVFTKADKSKILSLRSILQPLADRQDPVAIYWLAKTYDLYEFGIGDERDGQIALQYYQKAADLGMATTAYFLATVYRYSLMGIPKDERKVISYLERAKLHGDNQVKAEVFLTYASWYSPTIERDDFKFIPRNRQKMEEALRSAYALDPNNTLAAELWGDALFDRKEYAKALAVYRNSSNSSTQQRIAKMYETGKGTSIDLKMAVSWYKQAAKQQLLEDAGYQPGRTYYKSSAVGNLYRLVCQQKITPAAISPYFEKSTYEIYFQESLNHQQALKLRKNPCIPMPGG